MKRAIGRFRTGGVILIGLLIAGAMQAQDGLRFDGQVVDGATRLPVPGAEIELDEQPSDGEAEFTARADTFGFFAISDVPEGAYELRVVAPGFQPYEEAVTLSPEVKANRRIELTSVVGHVTFDVVFEVFDLATHVRLADAQITASYWNPDGDLSGGADQVIQAQTDVSGTAEIRGLSDGFYRFRITRAGWEPLDYEPSSDAGVVVGDKVRLVRSQLGAVYMKPIRTDLKVTVEGFDPVLNEAGQPLQEVTLQLTGYDFAFDREALPTESAMTGEDGAYTFTDLAPVNYVLSIGRLGYTAKEIQIEAGPDGTFTEVNETLELEPTELKVVLESPYKTVDAVKNARIILRGILDSHSEGIERELTAEIEAGDEERVSALFENLLPGRYWLHTVHEATISGFPTSSGPLPGAQSFRVSFFPRESYAELIPGQMEELVIAMEPVPAIVRGRLWATDEVGFLEEDPCFSEPYRVFYQMAQDGIEFIEHGMVDLLKEPHGMVVVNTDASGSYTALLTPGVFGVKIPGMAGYAGHNVECGELSAGLPPQPGPWPYPDPWPHSTLEFGHHRAGLGFNSDGEYQLDLFVHKHYINVSGRVRTTGAPFGDLVLRMNADGTDVLRFPYNHLWDTGTEVVLSGPVELRAALDQNNRYLIQNVPAGSYTLQLDHADYETPAVEVTIADWQAPGVIPAVAPFSPSYFFPGIVHCDARFDLEAAWRLQDTVRIDRYRYSASEMDYFSEGSRAPGYFRMPGLEDRLFTYSGQGLPTGVYRIWLRYGDGWYSEAGMGPLFEAFLGGPFNNVSAEAGAAPIGDFAYKLDLRAVSAAEPSRAVPGTMVEFTGGLMRQANTGQELDHEVSPYPTGASAGPEWSMSPFPGSKVELIDAATRRVKVTVYMNRNMVVSGTVKTAAGDPIPGAAVVFRNRFGSPAGQTVTSAQGVFQRTFASPQAIYLDINRRGFIPQRHRLEPPSLDNPDVTGLEYEMAPVPGPQIERFTMNRFGLFLPGVTRSGDSNIPILGGGSGFNPEAGRKKLTVTWEAEATPQSYSFELPGFVNQNEQQKTPEQFDVDDELAEVWIVDRRSFEAPFVNDPGQEDFLPVDPPFPLDYVTVRNWLSEITSAERNGRPYYVVHKVVLKNAPGSGNDVKETLNLWELPSGVFNPRVVAITKNGGVAVKDYELPETGGETPPHHLQGMNLPRWLSSVLEVVGTMAVLPKAEIDLVNKNYGDNYLKIGSATPKVEARIGVVPIEESSVIYDPAENLLESDLYLTYKYVVGVEMPLGEKTPAGGPLALAPKILGIKIDGLDAEFEVSGNERKACVAVVVPAPSEVKTEELNRKYEPVLVEDSGRRGGRVKFKDPQFSASAKLAACETLDATALGKNRISSYRLILEAQGTGEFGASVDLTPVIQALPYVGKPLHEINEAAGRLRRDGTKPVTLSAIFEALLGAKYTVEIIGDFPAPPTGSVIPGDTFPRWNFMGGQEVQGPDFDVEEAKKIILRLGVGLDLQAAYGAIQGTGLVQLGAPKGASDTDGVFFTLNPTDTSPLIKKIEGAVSFVLRAKLNLYVTKISKQWQHDFIVFVLDRSSEPSFTLTPLFITTTVIDAAGAPPYVFNGRDGIVLEDFYEAGSLDVNGAENPVLVFTGTDPATGEMTVMVTFRTGDAWSQPQMLARAPGVASVATARTFDGRWLAVWSEIGEEDLFNPFPASSLNFAVSDAGGSVWSEAATIISSTEAMFDLQLESTDGQTHLFYLSTGEGPLGENRSLHTRVWDGAGWGGPRELLSSQPLASYDAAAGPAGAVVVTATQMGELFEMRWSGAGWSDPEQIGEAVDRAISVRYSATDEIVVGWKGFDDTLGVSIWDPVVEEWSHFPAVIEGARTPEFKVLPFLHTEHQQLHLLTWIEGGASTAVWAAWMDASGELTGDPRMVSPETEGTYEGLHVRPGANDQAVILGRHHLETTTVREFDLAVWFGGEDLKTFEIPISAEDTARFYRAAGIRILSIAVDTAVVEYSGELEESPTVEGPWSPVAEAP